MRTEAKEGSVKMSHIEETSIEKYLEPLHQHVEIREKCYFKINIFYFPCFFFRKRKTVTTIIKQANQRGKKKGIRYDAGWLLECLLLQIEFRSLQPSPRNKILTTVAPHVEKCKARRKNRRTIP